MSQKQLKPFDLEAAKRGEAICDVAGTVVVFVGVTVNGNVVVEDGDRLHRWFQSSLRMAPKKRTVWVNFYKSGSAAYYDNADTAKLSYAVPDCIAIAVPVEIEE